MAGSVAKVKHGRNRGRVNRLVLDTALELDNRNFEDEEQKENCDPFSHPWITSIDSASAESLSSMSLGDE